MDYGERTTGTRDEHYNLVSVLYHALHGAETCDRYASDAEIAGDERLAAFFREAQGRQTQLAELAKGMRSASGGRLVWMRSVSSPRAWWRETPRPAPRRRTSRRAQG